MWDSNVDRHSQVTPDGPRVVRQATTEFQAEAAPSVPRCKIALVGGTGFTEEISCLLRHRLRLAGLIALAGFSVFLIRNLVSPGDARATPLIMGLHTAVVGVLTLVATLLWSHQRLGVSALRGIELLLFGSMALFFGYLQYWTFHHGNVLSGVATEQQERILSLATAGNSLRWFVLIVLYGTFIPNTWRRCAMVVGVLTAAPLVLNFATCWKCPVMGMHAGQALFEMSVALGMGAAIALFGSYKINALHHEAFTARQLGQYRLVRKLGSGGMGEVHLGEHVLLRRPCAIKLIHPEQAGDPTTLSRFEREVQAMATLTHWNTVEVYDYGHTEDGTFYYVMEYLPGMTLQDMVERHGPLSPGRAVYFLRQVCAALREAHAIGLIHRDIKPGNIIACQRGGVHDVAKLLDFGLVHNHGPALGLGDDAGKLTVQGSILGSPPFMSPEQALGRSTIDARTDVYSLGGLAYYLLTGQAPFARETAMETLMAHVHETVAPLTDLRPELPLDLQDVVLRCLDKDPDKRFPDVDSLDRALAECDCAQQWDADRAAEWWKRVEESAANEPALAGAGV